MDFVTKFESTGAKLRIGYMHAADRGVLDAAVAEITGKLVTKPPIELYGKVRYQRRSVGFFADPAETYGYFYSRVVAKSQPPGPAIAALLKYVNDKFEASFNGVLVHHYENEDDYASDEVVSDDGLDPRVGVVAISAGATRTMEFKRRADAPEGTAHFKYGNYGIPLDHASVMHMAGPNFQKAYTHGIPPPKKAGCGPRWSFTFRRHTGEGEEKKIAAAEETMQRIAERIAEVAKYDGSAEPAAKRAKV